MRIVILSQSDSIIIPSNIMKLSLLKDVQIIGVYEIISTGSLVNKKTLFVKGFGLLQSFKMGYILFGKKLLDLFDILTRYFILNVPRSIYSASVRCNSQYKKINDPNKQEFLDNLIDLKVDLCVSFSAPVIFKEKLLAIPTYGCINLHCSLLPRFAGLLPSFWTLYHNEKFIGSTVHFMDNKIDNGKILAQKKMNMPDNPTMFKVIQKTKDQGGDLMCEVVKRIMSDNLKPQDTLQSGRSILHGRLLLKFVNSESVAAN